MTAKGHDQVGNRIDPFKVTCDVCDFTEDYERHDANWSITRELSRKGWITIHIGMTPFEFHPDEPDEKLDISGMNNLHLCPNCSDPEWVNGTKVHQIFKSALEDSLFCNRCSSYLFHEEFKLCGTCMGETGKERA